jgi:hypothetical protein
MIRSVRRLQCWVKKTTSGHDDVDTAATNRGVVGSSLPSHSVITKSAVE